MLQKEAKLKSEENDLRYFIDQFFMAVILRARATHHPGKYTQLRHWTANLKRFLRNKLQQQNTPPKKKKKKMTVTSTLLGRQHLMLYSIQQNKTGKKNENF